MSCAVDKEQAGLAAGFALLHTAIYDVSLLQNVMLTTDACGVATLISESDSRGMEQVAQRTSSPTVCAPDKSAMCPYSLFNAILSALRFYEQKSLHVIDTNDTGGFIGLMFATHGGYTVCPGASAASQSLYAALSTVLQAPGCVGIWDGVISQHPVYSSSVRVKTQVRPARTCTEG